MENVMEVLAELVNNGGSCAKRSLTAKIRKINPEGEEPIRKFLEQILLIKPVSSNYNVTDLGEEVVKLYEKGKDENYIIFLFELIINRYQVAKYFDKFITAPGRTKFKREEFEKYVIDEWLLDFGYWKDDHIDRNNIITVAKWLGIINYNEEKKEYIIDTKFRRIFNYIEFLSIIRELANFKIEWNTINICEKLQIRSGSYMKITPSIVFILDRLIELQKENPRAITFSPGWPTPPVPPAFAFMTFAKNQLTYLRVPNNWKDIEYGGKDD